MAKKKKEKIVYIDDGRTIADMSNVSASRLSFGQKNSYRPRSTAKEKWQTYFGAVKMMFVPMLVVVCAILIVYMVTWFLYFIR